MTDGEGLPDEVKHFLREYISSVEQLEILLHLYRNIPLAFSSEEIARTLYISPESVAARVAAFLNKNLLSEQAPTKAGAVPTVANTTPHYTLNTTDGTTMQRLAELDRLYRERRVSVINFIFSNPIDTIQSFADAFLFGKRKG